MKSILGLLAALFLSGCAVFEDKRVWYKEGSTVEQFEQDKSDCWIQAMRSVPAPAYMPPVQVNQSVTQRQTVNVNIGNGSSDPSFGLREATAEAEQRNAEELARSSQQFQDTMNRIDQERATDRDRKNMFNALMGSKGWRLVKAKGNP